MVAHLAAGLYRSSHSLRGAHCSRSTDGRFAHGFVRASCGFGGGRPCRAGDPHLPLFLACACADACVPPGLRPVGAAHPGVGRCSFSCPCLVCAVMGALCDRLVSYLHHSRDLKRFSYVGDQMKYCRMALFCDAGLAGDKMDCKSASGVFLAIVGPRPTCRSLRFAPNKVVCRTRHTKRRLLP